MPENTTEAPAKKVVNHHANMEAAGKIDQAKRLVTNIGFKRGAEDKYEIYFLIPDSDEEAKARYDCSLADLIEMGVRKISTSPDYPTVMFDEEGNLKEGGHAAGQALADGYTVGRKSAGPSVKAKAAEHDALLAAAADAGVDIAAVIAAAKAKKNRK